MQIDVSGRSGGSLPFVVPIPEGLMDLSVDEKLPFVEQLKRHADIYRMLVIHHVEAREDKQKARVSNDNFAYRLADEDLENLNKALLPYAIAQDRQRVLIAQGYRLKGSSGQACKISGECVPVEPIQAMFYFTDDAPGVDGDPPPKDNTKEGCNFYIEGVCVDEVWKILTYKPLDTLTGGVLPMIRDFILAGDRGEYAKLIRDPFKRQTEIIQNIRDKLVPSDNSDAARILRDPIKCTVGKLFQQCKG